MNLELLARAQGDVGLPGAEAGRAFVIQVEPDLVAGERINVGVAVVTPDARRHVRMLGDYGRLEALYGRDVAELIEVLADFGRVAALGGEVLSASPSVSLTAPQPFFGVPAEQNLDQLFARMVPSAAPRRGAARRRRASRARPTRCGARSAMSSSCVCPSTPTTSWPTHP